jgi:hypothetical protein
MANIDFASTCMVTKSLLGQQLVLVDSRTLEYDGGVKYMGIRIGNLMMC